MEQTAEEKFSFFMEGTNGKAVLLIHGLTGAPSEMKYVAKYLNRQGFTVYCPLLAGHGVDETHILGFTWPQWVESVGQAREKLAKDYKEIYAAGICAGGMMALNYEALNPASFKGIALYSMTFRYDGWNVPKTRHINFLLPLVIKLGIPPYAKGSFQETAPFGIKNDRVRKMVMGSAELAGCLPGFPYRSLVEMYKLNDATRRLLPQVKAPIIVIHAREDDTSHLRNMDIITKNVGGISEAHILEDSYHMIHVDHEKDKVAKLTADFFIKNV